MSQDSIDINVYETVETVDIVVTPNITEINITSVAGSQPVTKTSELENDGEDGVNPFITLEDIPTVTPPTGLEAINEGNGIGWRLIGRDPINYGNIGLNAVDVSYSDIPPDNGDFGAIGNRSYAQGYNTIASGTNSHAEGNSTTASGSASHAEGQGTVASTNNAHAEGSSSVASGTASHAEGTANTASGASAHAEGNSNVASGANSHAEGQNNFARAIGEHAGGRYGTDYTPTNTNTDRLVNYGRGTSTGSRSDAFTLFRNGAVKFFNTTLASITNAVAGFFVFDSGNGNRPTIHNGTDWKALAYTDEIPPAITIDATPTDGSANAVSSNGVFDALATKFELPALTSGSVLFSNGSTIAQDNSQLFWDDVNNRLGIGTNVPTSTLDVNGTTIIRGNTTISNTNPILNLNVLIATETSAIYFNAPDGTPRAGILANIATGEIRYLATASGYFPTFYSNNAERMRITTTGFIGIGTTSPQARLDVRAQGALSTDIAFRVRNSADSANLFAVQGNNVVALGGSLTMPNFSTITSQNNQIGFETFRMAFNTTTGSINGQYAFNFNNGGGFNTNTSGITGRFLLSSAFGPTSGTSVYNTFLLSSQVNQTGGANGITRGLYIDPTLTNAADWRAIEVSSGGAYINTTSVQQSAILQADSTTKGFLPPRMTNAERLAIASPAIGLIVYCTDAVEGLYENTSTGWVNLNAIDAVPTDGSNNAVSSNGVFDALDLKTDKTSFVDYSETSTIVGWSSFTTKVILYKIIDNIMFVAFDLRGTSNSTSSNFTVPNNNTSGFEVQNSMPIVTNNGGNFDSPGIVRIPNNSNIIAAVIRPSTTNWTSSGIKGISGIIFFKIN